MKVLIIGAHPDDPEYFAGGTACKFVKEGHTVKFVSMTNGDAGHHELRGPDLAERRRKEAWAASNVVGVEYQVLNHHDGLLQATLEIRDEVIGIIRLFEPDLIMTHRPNDYHPDHRNTSILVQDSSYLLTVPAICPRVPFLKRMPVIVYMEDRFTKPLPFEVDVAVPIDETIEDKISMLDCHVSQFFEWLPFNQGVEDVPIGVFERREWLSESVKKRAKETADRSRTMLEVLMGERRTKEVEFAEVFEACEYGQPLTSKNRKELFPFF